MAFFNGIDWGDAPTWVAAALALSAGVVGYRIYRIESKRDDENAVLQRRRDEVDAQQQASLVCAWFEAEQWWNDGEGDAERTTVTVRNGSQLPVYDVKVGVQVVSSLDRSQELLISEAHAWSPVVPPGEHKLELFDADLQQDEDWMAGIPVASIAFTDASNRLWARDYRGALRLVAEK